MKPLALIIFVLSSLLSQAQNAEFWNDIRHIADRVDKASRCRVDLDIKMFSSAQDTTAIDNKTFQIYKYKKRTKILSGFITTYVDKKYMIVVDTIDKTITIMPPDKRLFRKLTGLTIEKADSTVLEVKQYTSSKDKCYQLKLKDEKVSSLDLCFDPGTYLMRSIVMDYKVPVTITSDRPDTEVVYKTPRVEINYQKIDFSRAGLTAFNYSDYFTNKRGKIILDHLFLDYSLINRLN